MLALFVVALPFALAPLLALDWLASRRVACWNCGHLGREGWWCVECGTQVREKFLEQGQ